MSKHLVVNLRRRCGGMVEYDDRMKCPTCDICGREVADARGTCTYILTRDDNVEKFCVCVCQECGHVFEEEVEGFYRELIEAVRKKRGTAGA